MNEQTDQEEIRTAENPNGMATLLLLNTSVNQMCLVSCARRMYVCAMCVLYNIITALIEPHTRNANMNKSSRNWISEIWHFIMNVSEGRARERASVNAKCECVRLILRVSLVVFSFLFFSCLSFSCMNRHKVCRKWAHVHSTHCCQYHTMYVCSRWTFGLFLVPMGTEQF